MISWHDDEAVKAKALAQITAHEQADEIVKGKYWENGKGCAVGCLIHSDEHERFETEFGIPEWCARLIDRIFEGLPNEQAKTFPRRFVEAVPVGKDELWWDLTKWQFGAELMRENIERVQQLKISDEPKKQVVDAIKTVLALHTQALETGLWDESVARSAASAADSAAWSAAESVAESAAWSAAESAESAAWSAESAAWSAASAADSAAWSAESAARSAARSARSAAYGRYADLLLGLLAEKI